ncbi:insulinase family protein [Catellatospora methionotrophica]|uniref:insulinase family protein n=1 Tax=Catellatospora methionotrophica TaxID=121620 RepID=UPI00340146FA
MIAYEIDGVPVLFVKAPVPLQAGLMFRVGRADEPLPMAGITHLVEHLAMHRHGLMDHHANASVGAIFTHFYTGGTATEVVAFFDKLCASLADLPLDRLAVEKEILRTEAAGRNNGVNADMPVWRYGAQGYGLLTYAEFGMFRVSAEDLRGWAAENFTRDNAVLWIFGEEVPAELRLSLPGGTRRPLPPASSALPSTPAYFHADADGVVMDTVVPRGAAAQLYAAALERALYQELRLDTGISYTAATDYSPRGDDMATVTMYVDALPEKRSAAFNGFVDVFKQLAKSGIDAQELEAVQAKALASLDHPDYEKAMLPSAATRLLTGHPVRTAAEHAALIREVTVADVATVAADAYANALLQVPYGVSAATIGFAAAPTTSASAVSGRRRQARGGETAVVVAADGVSVVDKSGQALTVRFADCVARLRWPDGANAFIGKDGVVVTVEPTLYRVTDSDRAVLDRAVPDSVTVPMPARGPDRIPKPRPPQRGWARWPAKKTTFTVLTPLTGVLVWQVVVMGNAWTPADGQLSEMILLGMLLLSAVGTIWVSLLGIHRLNYGRW